MCVPLRLRVAIVGDVDLTPDDRLHADLLCLPEQLDRTGQRAVVGERDRRHVETRGLLDEPRNPTRPSRIEYSEWTQVDKRDGHGKASLLPRSEDPGRSISSRSGGFAGPELVGEHPPGISEIGSPGHALKLPVGAHERSEIRLEALFAPPPAPGRTRQRGSIRCSFARSRA